MIELLAGSRAGRTLAEISRHLEVDKATCYPMLSELTRTGWLVRHARDKSYHLGPRLIAIGKAAEESFDILELARPRLLALAQQLGATCFTVSRNVDLVVVDVTIGARSARRGGGIGLRAGDRLPLRPPLGSVFVAWADEATKERWLAMAPGDRDHLRSALDLLAHRGFAVEQFRPDPRTLGELVDDAAGALRGSRRADQLAQLTDLDATTLVAELDADAQYYPVSINAPVFDADGNVTHAVCVTDLTTPVNGASTAELGRAVAQTAAAISRDAGSR